MPFVELTSLKTREVFPGYEGRFVHTDRMTLAFWTVQPGAAVHAHSHPNEQVVHVLEGEYDFTVDGVTRRLGPGGVAVVPANVTHSGVAVTACRILDVFDPCREDYR